MVVGCMLDLILGVGVGGWLVGSDVGWIAMAKYLDKHS